MVKINVDMYIDELRGYADNGKEPDLYSLKEELNDLSDSSEIFDSFEKESMTVSKESLEQMQDLSLLVKIRNLASQIKTKKQIGDKLHSLHFNLNLLRNAENAKAMKNAINAFLYSNETGIDIVINELNDFKAKLEEIKKHHSMLLPKSLDNKLEIESRYNKHIEQLHSIHKRQKSALVSTVKLFLKLTKNRIKSLKRFKKEN